MAKTDVDYFVNGINFKDYGVHVAASNGVTSKLAVKEGLSVDWHNYHGSYVDDDVVFRDRVITLECFIEADGFDDFISKYRGFVSQFEKKGTQRLKIDVGLKPLVYEVKSYDTIDIEKKWNAGKMVGTFAIKMVEHEPVKKVMRFIGSSGSIATITVSSDKLLSIHWGDGTHTFDVYGSSKTVNHTYSQGGEYEIIIAGVIDEITYFNSNCTEIWNKLL